MSQSDLIGVLLMAYGTPDTLANVEPYYTHIRGGRKPPPELVEELRQRYELVGGTTPLLRITEATRTALEERLKDGDGRYRVFLGMKHWHPYIEQAVEQMVREGIPRAVGLVLAPHYSRMSIAGYYRYVDAALEKLGATLDLTRIESWHLHPPFLEAVAKRVHARLSEFAPGEPVTIIFTAHSLPEKILDYDDPYPNQLRETAEALAQILALTEWQPPTPTHGVGRTSVSASDVPPTSGPAPDVARTLRGRDGGGAPSPPLVYRGARFHEIPPHHPRSHAQPNRTSNSPSTTPPSHTWTFSYQSAGHTPDPWLGPDLVDKVHELADAGVTNILVASIGFVSDHLEILYDIDHEAQQAAKERGITLKRTEMLNASPDFVAGLAQLIRHHLP